MNVQLKRAYEPAADSDGVRILVDRLWPRGLTIEKARVDIWLKDIAPSNELRQWFNHDTAKWTEFQKRYIKELEANPAASTLHEELAKGPVTLLYSAKDELHNQAVVLREFIKKHPRG